jgi:hypothetical protein
VPPPAATAPTTHAAATALGRSAPVAMMVTWISPSYASSMTAPKMMLQAGSARLVTTSETRLTSESVRSLPPVMLYTMPAGGGGVMQVGVVRVGVFGAGVAAAVTVVVEVVGGWVVALLAPVRRPRRAAPGLCAAAAAAGPTRGALDGALDERRRGGGGGGQLGAVGAAGHAHAQHGGAAVAHDGADLQGGGAGGAAVGCAALEEMWLGGRASQPTRRCQSLGSCAWLRGARACGTACPAARPRGAQGGGGQGGAAGGSGGQLRGGRGRSGARRAQRCAHVGKVDVDEARHGDDV